MLKSIIEFKFQNIFSNSIQQNLHIQPANLTQPSRPCVQHQIRRLLRKNNGKDNHSDILAFQNRTYTYDKQGFLCKINTSEKYSDQNLARPPFRARERQPSSSSPPSAAPFPVHTVFFFVLCRVCHSSFGSLLPPPTRRCALQRQFNNKLMLLH